ncbi:bifunctional nicotinamidase/pyrazinamidase [Fodinicurvata fenggangensis]|uniref:bifunctional nicotinamidase/pyrazinamidase n=1 Tax=Fodinicurvata fenggangensis TaxID=1121830 RepID=UPI00068BAD7F|nr:bifunctional nicotinamidase/pyrazinamidase [Fodinicurvata fenggangensis]
MTDITLDQNRDLLLVVDLQNDFCSGGALEVPEGERVVPVINRLIPAFANVGATQDWHPVGHSSFASQHEGKAPFETTEMPYGTQVLWPDHCVQGSRGAAFHDDFQLDACQFIVRKGFRKTIDSYSAFYENDGETTTGLSGYLRERGITRLFMTGLALDFCVFYSALDGRREGFEVVLINDATAAIDLNGSREAALWQMEDKGVVMTESTNILRTVAPEVQGA